MKRQFLKLVVHVLILGCVYSCSEDETSYEILIKHKTEKDYIEAINKSFAAIKKTEKKKNLALEETDILRYEYALGESKDSFQITYRFDEKGCYEGGIDSYINEIIEANTVVTGFKTYFETNANFKNTETDNNLIRWESKDGLMVVELDYRNAEKGRIALTIFAYE